MTTHTLRLYVAGQSPKSIAAIANLKKICEQYLGREYEVEIIDLSKYPALALKHQIVAIPTLIRQVPEPFGRIVGDLSNHEKVLIGLVSHIRFSRKEVVSGKVNLIIERRVPYLPVREPADAVRGYTARIGYEGKAAPVFGSPGGFAVRGISECQFLNEKRAVTAQ